jgi:hypothetical protein
MTLRMTRYFNWEQISKQAELPVSTVQWGLGVCDQQRRAEEGEVLRNIEFLYVILLTKRLFPFPRLCRLYCSALYLSYFC